MSFWVLSIPFCLFPIKRKKKERGIDYLDIVLHPISFCSGQSCIQTINQFIYKTKNPKGLPNNDVYWVADSRSQLKRNLRKYLVDTELSKPKTFHRIIYVVLETMHMDSGTDTYPLRMQVYGVFFFVANF